MNFKNNCPIGRIELRRNAALASIPTGLDGAQPGHTHDDFDY